MTKDEIAQVVCEVVDEVYSDREIDVDDHIIKFGSCPEDQDFEDILNTRLDELFPDNCHYVDIDTFHPRTINELAVWIDERYN